MSSGFAVALAVAAAFIVLLRFVLPGLPLRRAARPITGANAALALVGVLGLAFHCGAMFYRSLIGLVPGTDAAVSQINSMGTASIIWYIVPSALLLIGLRHQHPAGLVALTIALLAVGVTMYNGATLTTHLNTIFASVLVLALVVSFLILPPNRPRTARTSAALH